MEHDDLPRAQAEALATGSTRYFTGTPCKRGHVAPRYVCGGCVECLRERHATPERRAKKREHHTTPEYRAKQREYHATPEIRAKARDYMRAEGRGNGYAAARRALKLKATPPWLTDEHHAAIAAIFAEARTLQKETGVPYHVDHIIPLKGRSACGLHVPWNLRPLPGSENVAKNNRFDLDQEEADHWSWLVEHGQAFGVRKGIHSSPIGSRKSGESRPVLRDSNHTKRTTVRRKSAMTTTVFKTKKSAIYEAGKALAAAPEYLLITGIDADRIDGDEKGWLAVVYLDLVPGTTLSDEDKALLAPYVVRQQEREVDAPVVPVAEKAPGDIGKIKPRSEWAKSTAESPISICRSLVREMVDAPRADVIAALLAAGINKATAATQYGRIRKAMREEAPAGSNVIAFAAE